MTFGYRKPFVISHAQVGTGGVVNFPVPIVVTDPAFATVANGGRVTSATGYDIIITSDAAGTVKLDHEIVSYNAQTGALVFWVRVPGLSDTTDTTLYIQYGDATVTTDQSNKTGVWDANFAGVWHMADNAASTQIGDSTANALNGVLSSGNTNLKSTSSGISIASDHIAITSSVLSGTPVHTFSTLTQITATGGNGVVMFGSNTGASAYDQKGTAVVYVCAAQLSVSPSQLSVDSLFHKWDFSADGTTLRVYKDGVLIGTAAGRGAAFAAGVKNFYLFDWIGSPHTSFVMTGTVGETRLSTTARSAAWILTEYNAQSSPATFAMLGAETANTNTADGASASAGTSGATAPSTATAQGATAAGATSDAAALASNSAAGATASAATTDGTTVTPNAAAGESASGATSAGIASPQAAATASTTGAGAFNAAATAYNQVTGDTRAGASFGATLSTANTASGTSAAGSASVGTAQQQTAAIASTTSAGAFSAALTQNNNSTGSTASGSTTDATAPVVTLNSAAGSSASAGASAGTAAQQVSAAGSTASAGSTYAYSTPVNTAYGATSAGGVSLGLALSYTPASAATAGGGATAATLSAANRAAGASFGTGSTAAHLQQRNAMAGWLGGAGTTDALAALLNSATAHSTGAGRSTGTLGGLFLLSERELMATTLGVSPRYLATLGVSPRYLATFRPRE